MELQELPPKNQNAGPLAKERGGNDKEAEKLQNLSTLPLSKLKSNNVKRIKNILSQNVDKMVRELFPNAVHESNFAYMGNIAGDKGKSLKINLNGPHAGNWKDFSTEDSGDVIALYQAAKGLNFKDAMAELEARYTPCAKPKPTLIKKSVYPYLTPKGDLIVNVVRLDMSDNSKRIWQELPNGEKGGVPIAPLYRLPQICDEDVIIITEGEKCADALINNGQVATTVIGGSSTNFDKTRWTHIEGKEVILWPDNDEAGRKYMQRLAHHLSGLSCHVAVVQIPEGKPKGWDAADCVAEGGNVTELLLGIKEPNFLIPEILIPAKMSSVKMSDEAMEIEAFKEHFKTNVMTANKFLNAVAPVRVWLVEDWIPDRQVSLYSGDGGTGKSLTTLQLGVAAVTGGDWLGHKVKRGNVLYITAEDEMAELHRRIKDIAKAVPDTAGFENLHLRSLAEEDALMAEHGEEGLKPTKLYEAVLAYALDVKPNLIVLDTLADIYPANENDRAKVRQFVGLMRRIAMGVNCSVVVLSHPSLNGLMTKSGTSGSTAWSNSVRARMYLEFGENGTDEDPDMRTLFNKKVNYAKRGGKILMRYKNGAFVSVNCTPENNHSANVRAQRVFVKLLRLHTEQHVNVSCTTGANFAPPTFYKHSQSEGISKTAFRLAMETLLADGTIKNVQYGTGTRIHHRLQLVDFPYAVQK